MDRAGANQATGFLAVDLGAGSGRVMLGRLEHGALALEELHRFEEPTAEADGHQRWLFEPLFAEIVEGLRAGARATKSSGLTLRSVGVDGWGVDYGLLDTSQALIEDPVCYRDARTAGRMRELGERIPADELYRRTGIQFMPINTSVQLLAQHLDGEWPEQADRLLMVPDLVHFHLCGAVRGELSNASTTQLLDARTHTWDRTVLSAIGIEPSVMPELVLPGSRLGALRSAIAEQVGLPKIDVVAPATHDTASAVAGTPLEEGWAYVSSGTWCLVGLELPEPVLDARAQRLNFTNEVGYGGTTRLLRNVMGLWLFESCRSVWAERGEDINHERLLDGLQGAPPAAALFDPDHERFLNPADMPSEIYAELGEHNQPLPQSPVELVHSIHSSLALRCAEVVDQLEQLTGSRPRGLHVVGGGSRNDCLNQALADASGLPVRTGPVEATALGNVAVQAIAAGEFPDLSTARLAIDRGTEPRNFTPHNQPAWTEARQRFSQGS